MQTCRSCDCRGTSDGYNTKDDIRCLAEDEYVRELEELFTFSMGGKCAAMFIEPIQGVGGVVQYPRGYVGRAAKLVRQHGGLLVADEVSLRFCRGPFQPQ